MRWPVSAGTGEHNPSAPRYRSIPTPLPVPVPVVPVLISQEVFHYPLSQAVLRVKSPSPIYTLSSGGIGQNV